MIVEIDLGNGYSELFASLKDAQENLSIIRATYPRAKIVTGGSVEGPVLSENTDPN